MPRLGNVTRRHASLGIASLLGTSAIPAWAVPKTLSIGLGGDFPRLDPSKDTSPLGFNFRLNVFDALTEIERNGEVSPRLATKWSYSPDLTEWSFTLREGVTFHDGSPFTSADVVWTVQRILTDPASPVRTFLGLVKGVEATDGGTVKFTLVQPYAIFDRQMTYVSMMSKTYFDKAGDAGYASEPVGTGPYKLVRWVKDDRTVLQANPAYWRGEPAVKTATFRPIPSEASRATALLSGEIDLVPALPPVPAAAAGVDARGEGGHRARVQGDLPRLEPDPAAAGQARGAGGGGSRDRPRERRQEPAPRARHADGDHGPADEHRLRRVVQADAIRSGRRAQAGAAGGV